MKKIKEVIKNLRKTDRGKAAFKLGLWVVGFALLFITINVLNLFLPNIDSKEKEYDVVNALTELATKNYEYNYLLTYDNVKYNYNGTKYNNMEEGYFESSNGIIKYHYENDKYYQLINDTYNEIDNIYLNVPTDYLNFIGLANEIKNYDGVIDNDTIIYSLIDKKIIITHDNTNITSIKIEFINGIYELSFTNYKTIKEIKTMVKNEGISTTE